STAIMLLVEEGRVLLGDPVSTYLPPLAELKVAEAGGGLRAPKQLPTIQDLAAHLGPDLWRPRHHAGPRRLSRVLGLGCRKHGQGSGDRGTGQGAAAVRSGLGLGVRLLDRRAGLRRRGGDGQVARRLSPRAVV